ncbi:MAG: outer membrane lipoprotein carrier protein LolA [Salinivirgaceae bacterium]|nr:outer membrane lipoprotein carrier protein LolA [Salinivirgaceae bacterium]
MKHLLTLLIVIMTALAAAAQVSGIADMQKFESRLKETSDKLTSIESDFLQVKHLDMFDEDVTSKGKFYYLKDNKISLDYSQPLSYLIVINGSRLKIVADGKKNVMQLNTNKMMNEMQDMITACMVGDLNRMNDNYNLKYQEDNNQYIISITPRSKQVKDYVSAIEIRLSKADMSVDQLRMYENEADYTDYKFSNKRFNQLKDESRFAID